MRSTAVGLSPARAAKNSADRRSSTDRNAGVRGNNPTVFRAIILGNLAALSKATTTRRIYSEFAAGPTDEAGVPLPKDYYGPKMRNIVETQIEKAGIRLAMVLNDAFK